MYHGIQSTPFHLECWGFICKSRQFQSLVIKAYLGEAVIIRGADLLLWSQL